MKELCDCGKIAVWLYSPGYSNDDNPFYCDDCVTSVDDEPCSCNLYSIIEDGKPKGIENVDFKWYDLRNHPYYKANPNKFDILPEDEKYHNYYYTLDEKKRPYPCCEFSYSEDGFDK